MIIILYFLPKLEVSLQYTRLLRYQNIIGFLAKLLGGLSVQLNDDGNVIIFVSVVSSDGF